MTIVFNGDEQNLDEGATVRGLLQEAGIDPERKGIAVAVNGEVVPRETWGEAVLQERDRVDVIHAVSGGR